METNNGGGKTGGVGSNEAPLSTKSELKFRENLYRLIISQLFYDGYQHAAVSLSGAIQANPPCPPSNRLYNLIKSLSKQESTGSSGTGEEGKAIEDVVISGGKRLLEHDSDSQSGNSLNLHTISLNVKFFRTMN